MRAYPASLNVLVFSWIANRARLKSAVVSEWNSNTKAPRESETAAMMSAGPGGFRLRMTVTEADSARF